MKVKDLVELKGCYSACDVGELFVPFDRTNLEMAICNVIIDERGFVMTPSVRKEVVRNILELIKKDGIKRAK